MRLFFSKNPKWLIVEVFATYLLFVVVLIIFQRHFQYFTEWPAPDISLAPAGMHQISVETEDGLNLSGWLSYPARKDKPFLVFFHGNAQTIEHRLDKADPYLKAGYGVLLAEYRGYGGNPGRPTEEGLYKDARAYLNLALKDPRIAEDRIIIYGESLGSGVATQMATEYKPERLVLEVPFSSALDVAGSRFFFVPFLSYLMLDQYDNTGKIARVQCPVLIGTAGSDFVIPNRFGKKLFEAANEPKKYVHYPQAMHHTMYSYGFAADVMAFVDSEQAND